MIFDWNFILQNELTPGINVIMHIYSVLFNIFIINEQGGGIIINYKSTLI